MADELCQDELPQLRCAGSKDPNSRELEAAQVGGLDVSEVPSGIRQMAEAVGPGSVRGLNSPVTGATCYLSPKGVFQAAVA